MEEYLDRRLLVLDLKQSLQVRLDPNQLLLEAIEDYQCRLGLDMELQDKGLYRFCLQKV